MVAKIELALIPARGGSKELPRKNVLTLGGAPLIGWTIAAALASRQFHRVVVTTDDAEIADAAGDAGAEVPFIRPAELASDTASSVDVVRHALRETGCEGDFALLQPTSPLRSAQHLIDACDLYRSSRAPALVSIARAKPPEWALVRDRDGYLEKFVLTKNDVARRQDGPQVFQPNGAIYLTSASSFFETSRLLPAGTIGFEMGVIDSSDIDTLEDYELVRAVVDQGLRSRDVV